MQTPTLICSEHTVIDVVLRAHAYKLDEGLELLGAALKEAGGPNSNEPGRLYDRDVRIMHQLMFAFLHENMCVFDGISNKAQHEIFRFTGV